jgi:tetratricopeptide (TPR) repeat protein
MGPFRMIVILRSEATKNLLRQGTKKDAREAHMKKATIFFLAAVSILMVLAGCATVKKTLDYFGFGGSAEQRYAITNRQVSEFASRIRPARGNPDSHYLLACYYQERGRYGEALEEFKKVVAIDPEHANAYNGMGIAYDRLMDHSRAVEAYQLALKLNPSLDYVFNNLGYSYLLQGNYESAIHSFENAVALNGGNRRMHNNLGMALGLNQQFDRALEEFELAGDKARAHYNLAQIYFQHGMIDEARSSFCDALIPAM